MKNLADLADLAELADMCPTMSVLGAFLRLNLYKLIFSYLFKKWYMDFLFSEEKKYLYTVDSPNSGQRT